MRNRVKISKEILEQMLQEINTIEDVHYKAKVLAKMAPLSSQGSALLAKASQLSQKIENTEAKAKTLARIATQYALLRKWEQASTILNQAAKLANTIENPKTRATVLHQIAVQYVDPSAFYSEISKYSVYSLYRIRGVSLDYRRDSREGKLKRLESALKVANAIEITEFKDETLVKLGEEYADTWQYEQALQVADAINDGSLQGKVLSKLIIQNAIAEVQINSNSGRQKINFKFDNGLPQKILKIINDNNADNKIEPLINVAVTYSEQGKYDQVIRAINLIQNVNDKAETLAASAIRVVKSRHRIAGNDFGDVARYSQAFHLTADIAIPSIRTKTLAKIAEIYSDGSLRLYDQAVPKNLVISPSAAQKKIQDEKDKLSTLLELTLEFAQDSNHKQALAPMIATLHLQLKQYDQGLKIINNIDNHNNKARLLFKLASHYKQLDQDKKADKLLSQATQITQAIDNPEEKAQRLLDIAMKMGQNQNYERSEIALKARMTAQSIDNIEIQRELMWDIDWLIQALKLSGQYIPPAAVSSFNHDLQQLVEQNEIKTALELVEQSKARGLIDVLTGINPLEFSKTEYSAPTSLSIVESPTIDQIKKTAQTHQATLVEYAILHEDTGNPETSRESELLIWVIKPTGEVALRRVNLTGLGKPKNWLNQLASNPQSLNRGVGEKLTTIQQNPGIVPLIITLAGGGIAIAVWFTYSRLKSNRVQQKPKHNSNLKGRVIFEYKAKEVSWIEKPLIRWLFVLSVIVGCGGVIFGSLQPNQVSLDNRDQKAESLLGELVSGTRESIGVSHRGLGIVPKEDTDNSINHLQQLHQLLIEPIADLLPSNPQEKVIFIPDSALFFVPFPALQDAKANYLIEQHTILTAPSIQMLDLSRQKRQQIERISNNDVLIVGNPKMPSLPPSKQQLAQPLSPLPGAEQEAKAIASLLNTQAMTGESATEPIVLSRMLKARIIHLATHGLLDPIDERQFTPGAIALTSPLEWTPSSEPRVGPNYLDGFLSSEDIFGIPLNAELVVLSACDTGLGELTEDGILGLSRAFIMAGVPSLIVSLWSVPDAPTAELMIEFYQNLQQNPDKAQALRQAMLTIKKKYPNPKDWAAFTLIGESN